VGEIVAAGGTATVHAGTYKKRRVAIKMFKCELLTPKHISKFAQEAAFSHRLQHECIVESIGVCVIPPSICIVQEFMNGGSLFRVLKHYPNMPLRRRLRMARDIARGVAFLHSQSPPVLHRDLKSLNILIGGAWEAKLADLGEAREFSADYMTAYRGTPQWMAPEVFRSNNYSEKADVYSLGMLLWEIGTQQRPYPDVIPYHLPVLVCDKGVRPEFPESALQVLPSEYVNLTHQCWRPDPESRPDAIEAAQILTHLLGIEEASYDHHLSRPQR
jgi:serine/threonine protein kinase